MGFKGLSVKNVIMAMLSSLVFTDLTAIAQDQQQTGSNIHTEKGCSDLAKVHGQTAFIHVTNIHSDEGNIRVEIYANKEDEFLVGKKRLNRIDVPSKDYERDVCLILPAVDQYALVVIHDRNANDKADFLTEGFGFSNNIKLKLSKPDLKDVIFQAKSGVNHMDIKLSYVFISDHEKEEKRRKFRRR